jgi:hypothetical protein
MANREPSSDQNSFSGHSWRSLLILAALAVMLWLFLMFTLLSDVPPYTALGFGYYTIGPLGLVALATWAVRTGLLKPEQLQGRTIPALAGALTLVWVVFSTGVARAWDLWGSWEFLLIVLIPLTTGTFAGFLIRQGLLNVACAPGARSWFRASLWLICGGLLWAAAFPVVITFVFLVTG